jgi:hypothetical protein
MRPDIVNVLAGIVIFSRLFAGRQYIHLTRRTLITNARYVRCCCFLELHDNRVCYVLFNVRELQTVFIIPMELLVEYLA